ncbi:MAG: hypothetical protein H7Y17_04100 [Chlorobia bacterium]|nr:hypothetical protein [Fimbriimonadaceae bacterium]
MEIVGEWIGAYFDSMLSDAEVPIRATLLVSGEKLTGTMVDERSSFTQTIQQVISGIPSDSKHLPTWKLFASQFPDAILTTKLPENSRLHGKIKSTSIRFEKEYAGRQTSTWSAANLETTTENAPQYTIVYTGELSLNSSEIRGRWVVFESFLFGLGKRESNSGEFHLRRV